MVSLRGLLGVAAIKSTLQQINQLCDNVVGVGVFHVTANDCALSCETIIIDFIKYEFLMNDSRLDVVSIYNFQILRSLAS